MVLKLFRGFALMNDSSISSDNRKILNNLLKTFLHSEHAEREMKPTMWLSAFDFTNSLELDDLCEHCQAMFYDTFAWEDILTTTDKKRHPDGEDTHGRNFHRRTQ